MPNNFNLYVNRDENSFTARLFEGILFPKLRNSKKEFNAFLDFLVEYTKENKKTIKNNKKFSDSEITCWKNNDNINKFDSGMLFLELWDIYNLIDSSNTDIKPPKLDKTELDAVVLCKDKNNKQHLLVFEVKCYTDLKKDQIKKQKVWLEYYSKSFNIKFHHFVIIAYDNLINAKSIFDKNHLGKMNDLFVLTWDDFYEGEYLTDECLFPKECLNLHKRIGKKDNGSIRNLVKPI